MIKNQKEVLEKLGISGLNPMQKEVLAASKDCDNITLLSPTGSGKTLAFILPLLERIEPKVRNTQALILVPSRELALQIEQVIRQIGTGYKINALYGGRSVTKDKEDLLSPPVIVVGTPGRIADHIRNKRLSTSDLEQLVLDEFDKSLEIGFENDLIFIIDQLDHLRFRTLTSATTDQQIPMFVGHENELEINYLDKSSKSKLKTVVVEAPQTGKLQVLQELIEQNSPKNGIVFCNFRDSIQAVSSFLEKNKIPHSCFYGGMEQKDRERALIKFRNGSTSILLATDLAARGIDIPELKYIIHFELPLKIEEFTHRNGRTARVDKAGIAYVLKAKTKALPDFMPELDRVKVQGGKILKPTYYSTLFLSGGRKDKISKGDIAGMFFKQGNLSKDELGTIELKSDCAFVAVPRTKTKSLIAKLNNSKLKKRKIRLYEI